MNNPCPDKLEPFHITDAKSTCNGLFFSVTNTTLGNIQNAIERSDTCWQRAKDQIKGARTAQSHKDLPVQRIVLEHLKFTLQEVQAVPHKQIINDLRILIQQMEKERRDG